MRRVFASDLGVWPAFQDVHKLSDAMLASPETWKNIANYLILYDQIVVPTGNLQILPILRICLGDDVFDHLFKSKGIVLARYDQWLGYIGNGHGIGTFQITDSPETAKDGPNIAKAFFTSLDETIDTAIKVTNPPSTEIRQKQLQNLLTENVVSIPFDQIYEGVKEETYSDILHSPYLRELMLLKNAGRSMNALLGIKSNQVAIFNPHLPPAPGESLEIRSVLRVAFENLLLRMGGYTASTEITGDNSSLSVLRAKGQRIGFSPVGKDAFARIQEINGVPDLGVAFAAKQITAGQLLDLRYSKHAQALRDWFAAGAPTETADESVRRFVESLGKPSWIESLPAKLLRFATTNSLGLLNPAVGFAASAINTFLLSKWFPASSPRLFMKQAKVVLGASPVVKPPVMKGRSRNAPCSCGSGKKLKNCCGR